MTRGQGPALGRVDKSLNGGPQLVDLSPSQYASVAGEVSEPLPYLGQENKNTSLPGLF